MKWLESYIPYNRTCVTLKCVKFEMNNNDIFNTILNLSVFLLLASCASHFFILLKIFFAILLKRNWKEDDEKMKQKMQGKSNGERQKNRVLIENWKDIIFHNSNLNKFVPDYWDEYLYW